MTLPSTPRRAGPYNGNGSATSFAFTFKVFSDEDIRVVRTSSTGTETTLTLDSDYSVTLNGDQDTNPGGSVTYPISGTPLATGQKLTIAGALEYDQPTDIPDGGNFSPTALENALDRISMQVQQLAEENDRSVRLPVSVSGVSVALPTPEADELLVWNSAGTALTNKSVGELATVVAYANWRTSLFDGTGSQTAFTLVVDPGNINNLDVVVSGVPQRPTEDYTLAGSTLTFTTAPPAGTKNVMVRYGEALPAGIVAADQVTVSPIGTDARTDLSVQEVLDDVWDVSRYVVGGEATDPFTLWPDITTQLQTFFTRAAEQKRPIVCNRPVYGRVSSALTLLPASVTTSVGNPVSLPIDLWNLRIAWVGARNTIALTIGDAPGANRYDGGDIKLPMVVATGALQWPLAATEAGVRGNDTGIRIRNVWRTNIQENFIYGFSKNIEYMGSPYNKVKGGWLYDGRFNRVWATEGTNLDASFANQNEVRGGVNSCTSASAGLGTRFGETLSWDGVASYRGHNNNVFDHVNYEIGSGSTDAAHPIWTAGVGFQNTWTRCRSEGNRGELALIDGGGGGHGFGNRIDFEYVRQTNQKNYLKQYNGACGNVLTYPGTSEVYWHSGDVGKLVKASGTAGAYIMGREFFFITNATPTTADFRRTTGPFPGAVLSHRYAVCLDALAYSRLAVAIDTSTIKDLVCSYSVVGDLYGRPQFFALDSAGALLTGSATDPLGNELYVKGCAVIEPNALTAGGNGYSVPADVPYNRMLHITVRPEVKTLIFSVLGPGGQKVAITSMSVKAYIVTNAIGSSYPTLDGTTGLRVFSPLDDDGSQHLASALPSTSGAHGYYARGQRAGNTAAASGAPAGFVCTTTGWLARAWAGSTAYEIAGMTVTNDSGKIYELVTPGTSASSGGPTGTGASITDGSCVWNYIGVKAVFGNEANAP